MFTIASNNSTRHKKVAGLKVSAREQKNGWWKRCRKWVFSNKRLTCDDVNYNSSKTFQISLIIVHFEIVLNNRLDSHPQHWKAHEHDICSQNSSQLITISQNILTTLQLDLRHRVSHLQHIANNPFKQQPGFKKLPDAMPAKLLPHPCNAPRMYYWREPSLTLIS